MITLVLSSPCLEAAASSSTPDSDCREGSRIATQTRCPHAPSSERDSGGKVVGEVRQ